MNKPLTNAELCARFGRMIFGSSWGAGVARLAHVNERTVQRIATAARDGQDHAAARGVLAALAEGIAPIAAELEAFAREPADTTFEMRLAGAAVIEEVVARKKRRSLAESADAVFRAMQLARLARGRADQ